MAELIYSTKEVFTSFLKDRIYKIPEYQRGYKWNEKQITQLIADINDFDSSADQDLFYCLQNITLYPSSADSKVLHVVDGQQRLTTTYLLFCYLESEEYLADKFIYAVRDSSNSFIQKIQRESKSFLELIQKTQTFIEFCELHVGEDYDHQDIFYMYNAVKTFEKVFSSNNINIQHFAEKLKNNVKFIVNEIHSNLKEQELFMNLNTGKVPLDGADLVRAILITRVAKEEMSYFKSDSLKDIVRLNEKRTRIGWELDEINQWWSQDNVKNFFKPFVKIQNDIQETIQFSENLNPINILYKLWAETKVVNKEGLNLKLFEHGNVNSLDLYRELVFLNRTLKDWYNDRELYHFMGILANNLQSFSFKKYYDAWKSVDTSREEFVGDLKKEIRLFVFGKETYEYWREQILNYEGEIKTNWYQLDELEKFLILIDVIEISKNPSVPFLSPLHFKKNNEDKEHIYPCVPKNMKELERSADDYNSISNFVKILKKDENLFPYTQDEWNLKTDIEKETFLSNLESRIHALTPINSIGNLVLLHYSINRGFGNDYYIDKRASVINNIQNGNYVRQHTLSVFVKGRTDTDDLNSWTFADISNNAELINEKIRVFFDIKEIENEEPAA